MEDWKEDYENSAGDLIFGMRSETSSNALLLSFKILGKSEELVTEETYRWKVFS